MLSKIFLLLLILRRRLQKAKEKRNFRFWVRDFYKLRKERGEFHSLLKEAALFDHEYFFKLFRMTPRRLDKEKQHTTGNNWTWWTIVYYSSLSNKWRCVFYCQNTSLFFSHKLLCTKKYFFLYFFSSCLHFFYECVQ